MLAGRKNGCLAPIPEAQCQRFTAGGGEVLAHVATIQVKDCLQQLLLQAFLQLTGPEKNTSATGAVPDQCTCDREICNLCKSDNGGSQPSAQVPGAKLSLKRPAEDKPQCTCFALQSLTAEDIKDHPATIAGLFVNTDDQMEVQVTVCSNCRRVDSDGESEGISDVESVSSGDVSGAQDQLFGGCRFR